MTCQRFSSDTLVFSAMYDKTFRFKELTSSYLFKCCCLIILYVVQMYGNQYNKFHIATKVKGVVPVSLIIFLRVNIYLQNISIKRRLSRFHGKTCTACLSALLNVHVPISKLHAQMSPIFTLQYEFELSTLPSIPSNGHVGGLCLL